MATIQPMLIFECQYSDDVWEKYKNWIWQEKQNGTRNLIHIKDEKVVAIRNRSDSPVMHLYPELSSVAFKGVQSAIFDCEIVVMDANNKSIFYGGINQRDKAVKSAEHRAKYPVKAMLMDCLYLNGQILTQKPYTERYQMLRQSITDNNSIEVVRNIDNPKEYWENVIIPENREGFVLKNPKGIYQAGVRTKEQLKLKNYKRNDVIVDSLEANPKGVKIYGHFDLNGQRIDAEVQWSSMGCENIKVGDAVEVEYLDIVNNKLVQPHKVKGSVVD